MPRLRSYVRTGPLVGVARVWDWRDDALCALPEHADLLWFPDEEPRKYQRRKGKLLAQAVCAECPVAAECRAYAESLPAAAGVWAGRQYYFDYGS